MLNAKVEANNPLQLLTPDRKAHLFGHFTPGFSQVTFPSLEEALGRAGTCAIALL